MTLWSVASVLTLAFIFWLNAVMTASPYIVYLSGLKKQSERKNSLVPPSTPCSMITSLMCGRR